MKKIILGLGLMLMTLSLMQAQVMLDGSGVFVEKYYKSTAADAAKSKGVLPVGSVTWRVWVDLAPGYRLSNVYGDANRPLVISTTTKFYNNTDRGGVTPVYDIDQAAFNTVMLDSWLSNGTGLDGYLAVPKSEDTDGAIVNADGILLNADPSCGTPISVKDGIAPSSAGVPEPVQIVGITAAELKQLNATSQWGGNLTVTNGGWGTLIGAVGATASNRVLIGQFTTDGDFHFQINLLVRNAEGDNEYFTYGALDPSIQNEYQLNALSQTVSPGNKKPLVSILTPAAGANLISGDSYALTANASDLDGSITNVEFFVDGISVGADATAPYSVNYVAVTGNHSITAVATDNEPESTTSVAVNVTAAPDQFPTVSLTLMPNDTSVLGDDVTILANATDDIGVVSVEFFDGSTSLGIDNSNPYSTILNGALGTHNITAKVIDTKGQATTSAVVKLFVKSNTPPTASIFAPVAGSNIAVNTSVAVSANAADVDGTITQVEFFYKGVSIGVDNSTPYSISWTAPATEDDAAYITAVATDNKNATNPIEAKVNFVVFDPNAKPYQIDNIVQKCLDPSVCMPVSSKKANMANVIGFDVVMTYNKAKVTPTGNITVYNELIANANYVSVVTNIDSANSLMNISIYLNGTTPAGTTFNGAGKLFCAEFNRNLATFNPYDTVLFTITTMDESYATEVKSKLVKDGTFRTYKDSTFTGTLKFWSDNSPIKYDIASPSSYLVTNIHGSAKPISATNTVVPDLAGKFIYNTWNGLSIDIVRDILNATDVASVITQEDARKSALVSSKLKTEVPSAFQVIAADVNTDGVISAGDASLISQRSVNKIGQFPQTISYGTRDWRFVSSIASNAADFTRSVNFPNPDATGFSKFRVPAVAQYQDVPVADAGYCPLISNESYIGIMLGDYDGNYASIPNDGSLKNAFEATNSIVIDLSNAIKKDNVMVVPVNINTDSQITSFGIAFEKSEKIADISINNPNSLNNVEENKDFNNKYYAGAYNLTEAIPAVKAVTLTITTKSANDVITASDFISVNGSNNVNGNSVNTVLKVTESTNNLNNNSINNIFNVYPNPTSDKFNVMVSENSILEIVDVTGKVISTTNITANQLKAVEVNGIASGVYMMKVTNNSFVKTQTVIVK